MLSKRCAVVTLSAALVLSVLIIPDTSPAASSYLPGEILVRFKPETSTESIEELHAKLGTKRKVELPLVNVQRVQIAPGLSVEEAVALYQQDPNVLYAEPNYIRRAFVTPNDPDFDQQWGLHNTGQTINTTPPFAGTTDADIDAPEAWDITTGSDQIIVAVIDSGVDYNHPDLDNNIWTNPSELSGLPLNDDDANGFNDDVRGWDFVGTQNSENCPTTCNCATDDPVGDNDPMDDFGHGTHVAGIAAAEGNNGEGIAGVMWRAQIMPLKIIDKVGCGSVGDEVQAIEYAIAKGASIINASFGGEGSSEAEQDAIAKANAEGIVFAAAAGNFSQNNDATPIFPASYRLDNVISVAASNAQDRLAAFSNFGQGTVDVAAPGDCVLSTTPPTGTFTLESDVSCSNAPITPDYAYLSGTSMAAPHVSGVAGLLLSQDPSLTPDQIKAIISLTADPLSSLSGLVASSGRLNARKALLREAGSGLTGGDGGCGGLGFLKGDPVPPGTGVDFIAVFVLLFLLLVRRWRWRRIPYPQKAIPGPEQRLAEAALSVLGAQVGETALAAEGAGIPHRAPMNWTAAGDSEQRRGRVSLKLMLLVLVSLGLVALGAGPAHAEQSAALNPFALPHSVALKLGYHRYPTSDYFDTNAAYFDPEDFAGVSGELEYDFRWEDQASLSFALGYYDGKADASEICCTRFRFSTTYFLITPKYHIPALPLDGYLGAGIGYYLFELKQSGLISDTLSTSLSGFHILIGAQWALTAHFSTFVEVRYAWATVKSANALDDSLGIGGTNLALGVAYHFSGFR